ncbi:MAG: hypothetical protein JXO22_17840 [Phycisphaerae bacterium]|nr:hypothetical protein [Phycisphaerae bacterium]
MRIDEVNTLVRQLAVIGLGAICSWCAATAPPLIDQAVVPVGVEPVSPHQRDYQAHQFDPVSPQLLRDAGETIIPLQTRSTTHPCRTIFGYLPYWSGTSNLRYDLLTHVACFGVDVNANGTFSNTHGWPWTTVINNAHAAGTKAILVAVLFDTGDIYTLITTPSYKNAFFVNIRNAILAGNADGVNIDFEGTGSYRNYINGFMADLTAYLHSEIPGSEVTFAGPSVNWDDGWDLPGLAASCDGIFIMGYAFAGSWSSTSWPNAPLVGYTYNITNTVVNEYYPVAQNNPEKLILGVPYYGHHWTTATSSARSTVISFIGSTRFYNDEPNSQTYGLIWDSVSQTPWYRWNDGTNWHQVWFDNADSLGLKYDLANQYNLQGVGMWALDYDGSRPELWDALELKIGLCATGGCCDLNGDGHIDFSDFPMFRFCMAGPDFYYLASQTCFAADADGDADVDLGDFAIMQESRDR